MKGLVLAAALSALSACATTPTASQQAAADYGTAISQADAESRAVDYMRLRLKDPASASYEWDTIAKGWREGSGLTGSKPVFGYMLTGRINAKNSMGGFTGFKPYQFLFRDGTLVAAYGQACLAAGSCYMQQLD